MKTVMFERKIILDTKNIRIHKKEISWSLIIGIRIFGNDDFFSKIDRKFPVIELLLTDGRVRYLSKRDVFFLVLEDENVVDISIKEAISIIKNRAVNKKTELSNWLEWRLILPMMVMELYPLFVGIINKMSIEEIVRFGWPYGIAGAIIGLLWEKKAKNIYITDPPRQKRTGD